MSLQEVRDAWIYLDRDASAWHGKLQSAQGVFQPIHWVAMHRMQCVLRLAPHSGRIVDIGCSYGIFAVNLAWKKPRVEVVGLDTIRPLPGGKISLSDEDVKTAQSWRERYLQTATTVKRLAARKATPVFTGDLEKDFAGAEIAKYEKEEATACRTAIAWDEQNLYVGWAVKDATPWVNGADAPEFMYARGDTVDLQLGTDPKAPRNRKEAVLGDLRVVYCRVHQPATGTPEKAPPPWRLNKSMNGGGILMNWGCYDLDFLLGPDPAVDPLLLGHRAAIVPVLLAAVLEAVLKELDVAAPGQVPEADDGRVVALRGNLGDISRR
jgi:hypothetical protein